MTPRLRIAVTGAFGYSGRYIAEQLLALGHKVITLTNSANRKNPFGGRVSAFPLNFADAQELRASLMGVDVLINTYWVRFDYKTFNHEEAVANTKVLFEAAKAAGVKRILHVSITNPDINSSLPYFRGKAEVEQALEELGLSYCILRPAVLFGKEDVLINNIAWSLRHLPVFGVFGRGDYKLQPIHVEDLAALAVTKAIEQRNEIINAIGPETFTYRELVEFTNVTLGLKKRIISVSPAVGYWGGRLLGLLMRDVVITREEIRGLMEGRLAVDAPPVGPAKLSKWIFKHRNTVGMYYANELARRLDRLSQYNSN
jgi:NADH dehydrogenase